MMKRIIKALCTAGMILNLLQFSAAAAEYTIEAETFVDRNFEETTLGNVTAATLFTDEGADRLEVDVTLNERAEYTVELTAVMSMGESSCSPVSYSIDNGEKILLSEENVTKKSTTSVRWLAMPFSVYEINQKMILSEGAHTITFYADEARSSDESYYVCAFDKIVFKGMEIKTSFTFDGFGDDYQKFNSDGQYSGNYYGQFYSRNPGSRSMNFVVGKPGWYDVEMSIMANLTGTDHYVANMLCSIDGGEKFTLTDNDCVITDQNTAYWSGVNKYCSVTEFKEPIYFKAGEHNITFYAEEAATLAGGQIVSAIDYVTVSRAVLKDFVINEAENGTAESFTNYCEGDAVMDIILSAPDTASVKVTVNDTEYIISESTCTDARLSAEYLPEGNGWRKLRLNSLVHLIEGINKVKIECDEKVQINSVALRAPRNIESINVKNANVVIDVDGKGEITLIDGDGKQLTAEDVFSYSFSIDDESIAVVTDFGSISAKRSGNANISVSVTADAGETPYEFIIPVYIVRESGVFVKSAVLDGKKVQVKVSSTKTTGNVNLIIGKRNSDVLSGFNEVSLKSVGTVFANTDKDVEYEFSQLDESEEIVVFVVDAAFNHLYGKIVINK